MEQKTDTLTKTRGYKLLRFGALILVWLLVGAACVPGINAVDFNGLTVTGSSFIVNCPVSEENLTIIMIDGVEYQGGTPSAEYSTFDYTCDKAGTPHSHYVAVLEAEGNDFEYDINFDVLEAPAGTVSIEDGKVWLTLQPVDGAQSYLVWTGDIAPDARTAENALVPSAYDDMVFELPYNGTEVVVYTQSVGQMAAHEPADTRSVDLVPESGEYTILCDSPVTEAARIDALGNTLAKPTGSLTAVAGKLQLKLDAMLYTSGYKVTITEQSGDNIKTIYEGTLPNDNGASYVLEFQRDTPGIYTCTATAVSSIETVADSAPAVIGPVTTIYAETDTPSVYTDGVNKVYASFTDIPDAVWPTSGSMSDGNMLTPSGNKYVYTVASPEAGQKYGFRYMNYGDGNTVLDSKVKYSGKVTMLAAPTGLDFAYDGSKDDLTMSFAEVTDAAGYTLKYNKGGTEQTVALGKGTTSYTISLAGMATGSVKFSVCALAADASKWFGSAFSGEITFDITTAGVPQGLDFTCDTSKDELKMSFSAVADAAGYTLKYSIGSTEKTVSLDKNTRSYTISIAGLANSSVKFSVCALAGAGSEHRDSAFSAESTFVVKTLVPPTTGFAITYTEDEEDPDVVWSVLAFTAVSPAPYGYEISDTAGNVLGTTTASPFTCTGVYTEFAIRTLGGLDAAADTLYRASPKQTAVGLPTPEIDADGMDVSGDVMSFMFTSDPPDAYLMTLGIVYTTATATYVPAAYEVEQFGGIWIVSFPRPSEIELSSDILSIMLTLKGYTDAYVTYIDSEIAYR